MLFSLLTVATLLADYVLADADTVNIALLVQYDGAPVADVDVTFIDKGETIATDDTGYAFFGYPRGSASLYYPKNTHFNISIPDLGLNRQYLSPGCIECEDYEVAAVYIDIDSSQRDLMMYPFEEDQYAMEEGGDVYATEPTVYTSEETSTTTSSTEISTTVETTTSSSSTTSSPFTITASTTAFCEDATRHLNDIMEDEQDERALQSVPKPDPATGPYPRKPWGCGKYLWRLEKHVDLPCAPPNGAELVCATYIDGTPTGKKSIDEEKCSEVEIEAEITSEASAGIGNLGVKVGSKIGATRKVTSCFKVTTTIGENELKGKCGEICVRTKLKKITLRKWKHACTCDEFGWWMIWAPTGVLKDYEIATGYCDDTSDLKDC